MTPRRLVFSRDADRFLMDIAPKQYKQIVSRILDLAEDPLPHDSQKLRSCDHYRIDVGEFRVIYRFDVDTVFIDIVGKRNDDEVYRRPR